MTLRRTPTIVLRMSGMQNHNEMSSADSASIRRIGVCLLLALLLLYNPFLRALGSGSGLNLRHPASHRATVGSSELQEYAAAADQDLLAVVDAIVTQSSLLLPILPEQTLRITHSDIAPSPLFLCAGFWFRPPPAS